MEKTVQFQVLPEQVEDTGFLYGQALQNSGFSKDKVPYFKVLKRSIDARRAPVKYNVQVLLSSEPIPIRFYTFQEKNVSNAPTVHIVGAGPAGLYAALQAIELGWRPIIFERGKDVRSRRRDLAILNKQSIVNPESNYCFGEGGAGTYSDGKLYTRSKKRGNTLKAMEWLVSFGADEKILLEAHPHIGTNKLPKIISSMRETIISCGGEVHFESKLTNITINDGKIAGIEINGEKQISCAHLILATGHSARDIFSLLHENNITIRAKSFALGVRIEHPQEVINCIQYHGNQKDDYLPPASYSLVAQVHNRGVYSFCMCPGGIIAPCATKQEEVVTNGWSPSKRNNPYANSGIVVEVSPSDLTKKPDNNPFVCLEFQQSVERDCWEAAGGTQKVPAQRLMDFIAGKKSKDLPITSYQPGIVSVNLHDVLPDFIAQSLRSAFLEFGKKMKGYLSNDAILHAPESRTSSPISIPRNPDTLMHIDLEGLYPCGEGAGYAGGILSAAVDGMNCMLAVEMNLKK
ncbi:MAG: FAD-binding protein [Crocinitomicaceae bacterium]|nr:FAD-binding protein [Crocinitomicaceae bacterium]